MAQWRFGFGVKMCVLAFSTLLLSGCYKIEVKETLQLDGTSDLAVKMDMSQMIGAMTGMAEGMAQGFAGVTEDLENYAAEAKNAEKQAAVRNAATIMKTAMAVDSINSFSPTSTNVRVTLETEGGYKLPTQSGYTFYYGFTPGEDEESVGDFFVATCAENSTDMFFTDGTAQSGLHLKELGTDPFILCTDANVEAVEAAFAEAGHTYQIEIFRGVEKEEKTTAAAEAMEKAVYTSCNDPKLLEQYDVLDLDGPKLVVKAVEVRKETTCEVADETGFINIITTHIDTANQRELKQDLLSRKADDCRAPAILAFYNVLSFDEPMIEEYTIKESTDISCSEDRTDVVVSTITKLGDDDPVPVTQMYPKAMPVTEENGVPLGSEAPIEAIPTEAIMNDVTGLTSFGDEMNQMSFCDEAEQDPSEMPFFFNKCEDIAPGVGAFHFSKYDTTGFTINQNGTVTYSLESATAPVQADLEAEMSTQDAGDSPFEMNPAAMGFVIDYVLVSPWPILEHSAGTLEDQYTLRVNLLEADENLPLTVVLETDGASLNLLDPRTQSQIDKLIEGLKTKLTSSSAPVERQVEYIFHLSNKIQRLAALRPEQQVPLGYLQTKLIGLAEELQEVVFTDLEDEFLSELDSLTQESFDEVDSSAETEAEPAAGTIVETEPEAEVEIPAEAEPEVLDADELMPIETQEQTQTNGQAPSSALVEQLEAFRETQIEATVEENTEPEASTTTEAGITTQELDPEDEADEVDPEDEDVQDTAILVE